ncbi:hypothetical protein ACFX1R_049061 [Malus domestica]
MEIRGKMTKVKVSHLNDFEKLRTSKEVRLVMVFQWRNSTTSQMRSGKITRGPRFQRQGDIGKGNVLCTVGTIIDTLDSVGEKAMDALHVDKWDIELQFVLRISRCPTVFFATTSADPARCLMMVEDIVMPVNLIPLDMMDFDVILGTDWLHYDRTNIECYGKSITFHHSGSPEITFMGEQSGRRYAIILL